MNQADETSEFLSLEDRVVVDHVADIFESEWEENRAARMEDFLGQVPEHLFRATLVELLTIEIQRRDAERLTTDQKEYVRRFPQFEDDVRRTFTNFSAQQDLPAVIDTYKLIRPIGEGGFANVGLYQDEVLAREVAIKVSKRAARDDPDVLLSEIRALANFAHPAIVRIYAAGKLGVDRQFIVMEYLSGGSLADYLKANEVPLSKAIEIVSIVADALHKAHLAGFVHRDVKPANILLDVNGSPYLGDFGLAIHESEQHKFLGDGSGTMPYRAPEQVEGKANWMDARCDIWGLGVVLYELITGRRPFAGEPSQEIDYEIVHREPRSPRTINDQIPVRLQEACMKCLRKNPAERFTAADELADELRWIAGSLGIRQISQSPSAFSRKSNKESSAGGAKVFISYSHLDSEESSLVQEIDAALITSGNDCFVDTKIPAGIKWAVEIEEKLRGCDFFVVLISPTSMKSEMVQTEIRLAHALGREYGRPIILPIRVGECGPLEYELNLYLGALHYLQWTSEHDSQSIATSIVEAIQESDRNSNWQIESSRAEQSGKTVDSKPSPSINVQQMTVPGGTVKHSDPLYIQRSADDAVIECAQQTNTIVLKGPRQHGKSSLLMHYLQACQKNGKQIAYLDLSVLANDEMTDYVGFLRRVAKLLSHRLGGGNGLPNDIDSQYAMTLFIEELLDATNNPVVISFDEVDRLFGQPYQSDFFSMLRVWHNNRSSFLTPQWENVDLALAISTEPYLLISESDRSPFNVGLTLDLKSFTPSQCQDLNNRCGEILTESEQQELYELLGGHPYLTRLAFYHLCGKNAIQFSELVETAHKEFGRFGEHLRAILFKLHKSPELLDAMKSVVATGCIKNQDVYFRLYGAGLVKEENGRINPANLLYARYFRNTI